MGLYPERMGTPWRHVSLFTGGGGSEWAARELGWRTVCYVESAPFCWDVIRARIRDGSFDDAPIWDDIRTFDGRPWRGSVDAVSAGFPCPVFSVAGKRQGAADARNLWPDTFRVIREIRPRVVFLENVPGLLSSRRAFRDWRASEDGVVDSSTRTVRYFGRVLGDLALAGYDASWCVLSAARLGAPHLRKRLWVVATHADRIRPRKAPLLRCKQGEVAHANGRRRSGQWFQDRTP